MLELHGIEVVNHGRLENVTNIYDETAERAYTLARKVDVPDADAVFLSGVGLPTMSALAMLEQDLGKPVISSMAALTWASLRAAQVRRAHPGLWSATYVVKQRRSWRTNSRDWGSSSIFSSGVPCRSGAKAARETGLNSSPPLLTHIVHRPHFENL